MVDELDDLQPRSAGVRAAGVSGGSVDPGYRSELHLIGQPGTPLCVAEHLGGRGEESSEVPVEPG